KFNGACTGSGSVEALYETLERLIEEDLKLIDYRISSGGQGKDALAEATVQLLVNNKQMTGRATAQDVIKASANAFLHAVNRYVIEKQVQQVETDVQYVERLKEGKIVRTII